MFPLNRRTLKHVRIFYAVCDMKEEEEEEKKVAWVKFRKNYFTTFPSKVYRSEFSPFFSASLSMILISP